MNDYKQGTPILDRTGDIRGELTGSHKLCTLEGCRGLRVLVRWQDGKRSWPCTKGLTTNDAGTLQIR